MNLEKWSKIETTNFKRHIKKYFYVKRIYLEYDFGYKGLKVFFTDKGIFGAFSSRLRFSKHHKENRLGCVCNSSRIMWEEINSIKFTNNSLDLGAIGTDNAIQNNKEKFEIAEIKYHKEFQDIVEYKQNAWGALAGNSFSKIHLKLPLPLNIQEIDYAISLFKDFK